MGVLFNYYYYYYDDDDDDDVPLPSLYIYNQT